VFAEQNNGAHWAIQIQDGHRLGESSTADMTTSAISDSNI